MKKIKSLVFGEQLNQLSTKTRLWLLVMFCLFGWTLGMIDIIHFASQSQATANLTTVILLCLLSGISTLSLAVWLIRNLSPLDHHLPSKLGDIIFWLLFASGIITLAVLQRHIDESSELDPMMPAFLMVLIVNLVRIPPAFAILVLTLSCGIYVTGANTHSPGLFFFSLWAFSLATWGLVFSTNTELLSQRALRQSNDQLRLAQSTIEIIATQNERLRISRDLHDEMGHLLTALSLQLQICQKLTASDDKSRLIRQLEQAQQSTESLFSSVRHTVHGMRNGAGAKHSNTDLMSALEVLINDVESLTIKLRVNGDRPLLSFESTEAILFIVKECITNTLRHSSASSMIIGLTNNETELLILIEDNGGESTSTSKGVGLLNIEERVQLLGGSVSMEFLTGRGFVVQLRVPME